MLSVVHLSDCPKLEFIQPHILFVIGEFDGRLRVGTPRCGVRCFYAAMISTDGAAHRPYQI